MALTIKDELRRAFELATLRKEAEHIRTPRQWQAAKDLIARCDEVRGTVTAAYRKDYAKRVEIVQQRIIDEAGRWVRTLRPYGQGADRFSPADTRRQAEREVRDALQRRLDRINDIERSELRRLTEDFRRENERHGDARAAFTLATDRRANPDRRSRVERRRSFDWSD